jgi:hypothetical protein
MINPVVTIRQSISVSVSVSNDTLKIRDFNSHYLQTSRLLNTVSKDGTYERSKMDPGILSTCIIYGWVCQNLSTLFIQQQPAALNVIGKGV